ncbi:MAG: ACP S-malonyltransferase [Phycisphaerae bacterium]
MTLALLCPGQGAQLVGMGKDFYHTFGVARRVFDQADHALHFSLSKLCFEGPEESLTATDNAQVAIYVTGVAIYETLLELGKVPTMPAYAAGLSLGEYTALHLAGVLTFEDGLKVVRARGQLMQAAANAAPSTMVALIGVDEAAAAALCQEAAQGDILVPANFNAPGQVVLSGAVPACERAAKLADTKGFKATMLTVAGAFHSPFMQSAADQMAQVLAEVRLSPARIPVLSNVTGKPHGEADSIRELLVKQVVSPVRWLQGIEYLRAQGVDQWLEIGPNRHLTGMMKRIDRRANITNVSTTEGLTPAA